MTHSQTSDEENIAVLGTESWNMSQVHDRVRVYVGQDEWRTRLTLPTPIFLGDTWIYSAVELIFDWEPADRKLDLSINL